MRDSLATVRLLLKAELRAFRNYLREVPTKFRNWRQYARDLKEYQAIGKEETYRLFPCIMDRTSSTRIEPIYYFQDAWAFERIVKLAPTRHVDVGSHHKLVALLSKLYETTMVDIRPLSLTLPSLKFVEGSILDMPFEDESCESVSSICVIEHIGLGRYGDPIDTEGSVNAIRELIRILSPGGHLFVSVPIDDVDRNYFNAHRAFKESTFIELCKPLELVDKAYIFGTEFLTSPKTGFGTGCFEFVKPSSSG
ncbi:MAG: DUF268 domain-containing protein [Planctomycetota bacterium]